MKVKVEALAAIAAALTLVVAVPAAAHPGPGDHPSGSEHSQAANHSEGTEHSKGSDHSRRCTAHHPGFVESGTVDSTTPSTLAKNADGTWSGTLVLDVTRTNHWARADKGKTVTYTFTNAKLTVKFDNGTTAFTSGERVKLIGKIATERRGCTKSSDTAATPEFRMVIVHSASSTDDTSSGSSSTSQS